jgi:hypothetical protein
LILPEMNHQMTNALVFSPEGWATVSCSETGVQYLTQTITFRPDNPVAVAAYYLKDKFPATSPVYVTVNGTAITQNNLTRIGSGYQREVKVNWQGIVPTTGVTIVISNVAVSVNVDRTWNGWRVPSVIQSPKGFSIVMHDKAPYEIGIYTIGGRLVQRLNGAGNAHYLFGSIDQGKTRAMNSGIYIVRLTSANATINKQAMVSR